MNTNDDTDGTNRPGGTGLGVGGKIKGAWQVVHGVGEIIRGRAMGAVDNVARYDGGKRLNDDIAMRGRIEVEEGMAALRGGLRTGVPGTDHGMGTASAGGNGTGVGGAGYGAGTGSGAATGVGDGIANHDTGLDTDSSATSSDNAKGRHVGVFTRPGSAHAVDHQYRGKEKSQEASGGATEHSSNFLHTSAAPTLPHRTEEQDLRGSQVQQTGQQQAPPPYTTTEA